MFCNFVIICHLLVNTVSTFISVVSTSPAVIRFFNELERKHTQCLSLLVQVIPFSPCPDPYEYRRKRSTMTEAETIAEDLWKVILLESLGNARLDQSYEHIVSHVNNTNSQWVKRAGVHALRDYHHDHVSVLTNRLTAQRYRVILLT